MPFDPQASAKKWADRLSQAVTDGTIERGVMAVTVAPGAAAARQVDAWAQNTIAAKDSWKKNVNIPVGDWQQSFLKKGKDRIATGAAAAEPKMAAFLTKLKPITDNAKANLPPRGSYAQNKARATAMMDALHNAKGSFR